MFSAACERAPINHLEREAKKVAAEARIEAEELGQFSQQELQRIWAIEYKTIRVADTPLEMLDDKLNELGEDRWECYHVEGDEQEKVFYFKRQESNALRYITDLLLLGTVAF